MQALLTTFILSENCVNTYILLAIIKAKSGNFTTGGLMEIFAVSWF